jgi:hypothetical protein
MNTDYTFPRTPEERNSFLRQLTHADMLFTQQQRRVIESLHETKPVPPEMWATYTKVLDDATKGNLSLYVARYAELFPRYRDLDALSLFTEYETPERLRASFGSLWPEISDEEALARDFPSSPSRQYQSDFRRAFCITLPPGGKEYARYLHKSSNQRHRNGNGHRPTDEEHSNGFGAEVGLAKLASLPHNDCKRWPDFTRPDVFLIVEVKCSKYNNLKIRSQQPNCEFLIHILCTWDGDKLIYLGWCWGWEIVSVPGIVGQPVAGDGRIAIRQDLFKEIPEPGYYVPLRDLHPIRSFPSAHDLGLDALGFGERGELVPDDEDWRETERRNLALPANQPSWPEHFNNRKG